MAFLRSFNAANKLVAKSPPAAAPPPVTAPAPAADANGLLRSLRASTGVERRAETPPAPRIASNKALRGSPEVEGKGGPPELAAGGGGGGGIPFIGGIGGGGGGGGGLLPIGGIGGGGGGGGALPLPDPIIGGIGGGGGAFVRA